MKHGNIHVEAGSPPFSVSSRAHYITPCLFLHLARTATPCLSDFMTTLFTAQHQNLPLDSPTCSSLAAEELLFARDTAFPATFEFSTFHHTVARCIQTPADVWGSAWWVPWGSSASAYQMEKFYTEYMSVYMYPHILTLVSNR